MTGFARSEGQSGEYSWVFELKTVNGRSLDLRCRLPVGFESLEAIIRAEVGKRLKRGTVSVTLTLNRTSAGTRLRVNRPLLEQVLALGKELEERGFPPVRLDALLAVRGVIEPVEESESAARGLLEPQLQADLTAALDRLAQSRTEEGARLGAALDRLLDETAALVTSAQRCAAVQPAVLREKLRTQLATLTEAVPGLPEDRLAQEVALLVARGDIREEIDRLRAHLASARELLAAGDAVGRRLDFLCQELNREANTLCAKSNDVELTRVGLALKATIEQFREQVQNIE